MQNRHRAHPGWAWRVPAELVGLCVALAAVAGPNRLLAQGKEVSDTSWAAVERALGRSGTMQPGGVYKFAMPRSDLTVRIGAVTLKPALALGSWLAFERDAAGGATAMGDLVLLESEVGPVMRKLQAEGIQQTALHNHVLGETPRIMYMHVMANGNPVTIARTISSALHLTGTPAAGAAAPPSPIDLDTAAVARALGRTGKVNGGVYQVAIPRAETIRVHDMTVPPSMGVATAINIQPTGSGRAVATGDFVLIASEVNPVIRALRDHNIEVTALHSHMLDESPRLLFMHFWANGPAVDVAAGLKAALDVTNSRK